jgi:Na+-transporting methylmalonyl-CoA/oxaloacetate decarboxylase gamma subunit
MIDWGQAGQLGAIGFSLVFGVLIVLAMAIWLVSRIINRIEKR